ncbi:4Fe-4S cluster-binding domain-containing protein [Hydrogenophaga sp.]|uniref:4Fe-4S cluster-binding domain-containing protein n=1 Tax=Hydrogenophaga sp. TaxID=1904254 RepID=UPI00286E1A21|nr:4Fe-4S cluster-binding domain-containing protein [Hydrogenophaga sp.]
MDISLSRAHFPVTALGPGRRVGIWLQGCSIRCTGCISSDTWAKRAPDTTVDELLVRLKPWLQECEGVTISGGEPFEQPAPLERLLRGIRQLTATDILVYSGRRLEQLQGDPCVTSGLIDCLISEPFESATPQTTYLMGSDNQKMTCLTPLGSRIFGALSRQARDADRRLDVMFGDDGVVWLAGIPSRGDMARLQHLLEEQGTYLRTTEAKA